MDIRFVCPCTKETLTEAACEAHYEYEPCMGCTSQQDEARKALCAVLQRKYGSKAAVTLEEHDVRIAVREDVTLLVDEGDWREGTYAEIDCGKYGSTHTHPSDVLQWVEDFFAGNVVILLTEGKRSVVHLHGAELGLWSGWNVATWAVDVNGIYPALEYAVSKGYIRR